MKRASLVPVFVLAFCGTALTAQQTGPGPAGGRGAGGRGPAPTTPGPDNRDQFIRTLYEALKTGQGR